MRKVISGSTHFIRKSITGNSFFLYSTKLLSYEGLQTTFSDRVEHYLKYRPQYPAQLLNPLRQVYSLTTQSIIADIGSGTGFLSELFLANGNLVYGVEPNAEMRQAGKHLQKQYPNFKSNNGSAEETKLAAEAIDFITAGQAFHWFDPKKCYAEFKRILKPGGRIALIWNERRVDTPFLKAYEALLRMDVTGYQNLTHRKMDQQQIADFLNNPVVDFYSFDYLQKVDLEGLKGRLLSSSYIPKQGQPGYEIIMSKAEDLYSRFNIKGKVSFNYETKMYVGSLS